MKTLELGGPLKFQSATAGDDIKIERTVQVIRCFLIGKLLNSLTMFRQADEKTLTGPRHRLIAQVGHIHSHLPVTVGLATRSSVLRV